MTWKFHIHATAQQRLLSRILQVLESQMVDVHTFRGRQSDRRAWIEIVFSSEQDKTYRIEALLYRLEGVQTVSAMPHPREEVV
jgi:(p)ppGpp synthase/HD superfamily hydrolase